MDVQEHRRTGVVPHCSGHPVSPSTVGILLKEQGYSLQANAKTQEGSLTQTATLSSAT